MKNDSPSPPPTAGLATPSGQVEPPLPAPNEGGPAQPSTTSSQPTAKPWFSIATLWSRCLELTGYLWSLCLDLTGYIKSKIPQLKPLSPGFEAPSFLYIATLTILCPATYLAFYILTLVAKDRSLFVVRAIVGLWGWVAGFALGYFLLRIGAQHLEAASKFALVGYRSFLRHSFKQPGPR